jgi:hypothetical protein
MLAHSVYVSLKDPSSEAKQKFLDSAKKYLSSTPGASFSAFGTLAEEFARPSNDRDFDVVLHVVFQDKAAHDAYQVSEGHVKFLGENRENWAKVRIFDSYVEG